MDKAKRKRLEARGWRVGTATDFLGLSAEEAALVQMKVSLSQALRTRREARGLSQVALANRLRSSQSRVAKMEAADRIDRPALAWVGGARCDAAGHREGLEARLRGGGLTPGMNRERKRAGSIPMLAGPREYRLP